MCEMRRIDSTEMDRVYLSHISKSVFKVSKGWGNKVVITRYHTSREPCYRPWSTNQNGRCGTPSGWQRVLRYTTQTAEQSCKWRAKYSFIRDKEGSKKVFPSATLTCSNSGDGCNGHEHHHGSTHRSHAVLHTECGPVTLSGAFHSSVQLALPSLFFLFFFDEVS